MGRIKDYAGFIGWFSGLGYIVLWPITSADLSGKPFGASIFCYDGAPSLTDFLCNSAHPLQLPTGLHAIGCVSAVFVTVKLLGHGIKRARRTSPRHKPAPARRAVKPRSEFGLRGLRR